MSTLAKKTPEDFPLPTLEQLEAMDKKSLHWLNEQLALIQGNRWPKNLEAETHAAIQAWQDAAHAAGQDTHLAAFDRVMVMMRLLYTASFDEVLIGLRFAGARGRKPMDVLQTRLHIAAWANEARRRGIS